MKRFTISIENEQNQQIEDEAEVRGVSKSHVVRERLSSGEESGEDIVNLQDRVNELERRLDQLEQRTREKDERRPQSDSTGETMNTLHPDEENAGSGGGPSPEHTNTGGGELKHGYERWVEEEGPNTVHGKWMVMDLFDKLREDGIVTTSELREGWYDEWPDAYGDAKSLWDSMKRHVKGAPGVEHPGTGQWRYAGDTALREALAGFSSSED